MKMMMSNARDATTSSWLATTLSLMIVVASMMMMMFSSTVEVSAFSSCSRHNNHQARLPLLTTNHPSTPHPTTLYSTIDDDASNNSNELQALGNSLILSAARYHGATDKMISIDWKADRIIVTVDVSADEEYEGGSVVGELEEYDEEDFEDDYDDDEDYEDEDFDDEEEEDFEALQKQLGLQPSEPDSPQSTKIDLTLIARTINEYLSADGESTPQFKIAQLHEIEVTTPEFDNVLRVDSNGVNMFEVYKGFDVIVDYWEVPKKKKSKKKSGKAAKEVGVTTDDTANQVQQQEEEEPKKTQKIIEGKLVGRDEEKDVTLINVKGRIIKIKNDMIESVTLPKAKREKGAK